MAEFSVFVFVILLEHNGGRGKATVTLDPIRAGRLRSPLKASVPLSAFAVEPSGRRRVSPLSVFKSIIGRLAFVRRSPPNCVRGPPRPSLIGDKFRYYAFIVLFSYYFVVCVCCVAFFRRRDRDHAHVKRLRLMVVFEFRFRFDIQFRFVYRT